MEPNSFTREPQYQRPDQRNSDIDYIRNPLPIIIEQPPVQAPVPVPVPVTAPVIEPVNKWAYDGSFGKRFINKFGSEVLRWHQMDYYANAIPLGSFSFALAFIIYGFYRCKVYTVNDTFLWSVILLFGGIGQCTAGFLEYCKGRGFPSALYLTYGFYCLSHYALYIIPQWFNINSNTSMLYNYTQNSICCFYSAWVVLSFGILIASVKTNLLYILQCLATFVFFLLRAIGEGRGSLGTKRHAAGIFQAIAGFFSLLICFSQLLNNETFYRPVFPTCPMSPYNEIDIMNPLPAVAGPAGVPVV
jgi:succinate-acetate transporter protein